MGSLHHLFFGFFRLGELVANSQPEGQNTLQFSDLALDSATSPSMPEIRLRHSKTNQLGMGVDVFLGRSFNDLCPVSAMLAFLAVRGGEDGPLFCNPDGTHLLKSRVVSRVRLALETLGLCGTAYAGHSFRIGAATTAAKCSLEDSLIKALGRWERDAFRLYVYIRTQLQEKNWRQSHKSYLLSPLTDLVLMCISVCYPYTV